MGKFGILENPQRRPDLSEPFIIVDSAEVEEQPINLNSKERLSSLDVFRGLSIAMMILVDNAGDAWPSINHSPWNGVTLADLVMPCFLFIVGVALALTYKRIPCKVTATRKALLRSLKLFLLGVFLQGGYFHGANDLSYGVDFSSIRWFGILQRIAFVYLIVALCEIWLPRDSLESFWGVLRGYIYHWIAALVAIIFYLSLLYGLRVPDWDFQPANDRNKTLSVSCGTRGALTPACNAVGFIDREIIGVNHLYHRPCYIRTKACSVNSPDYGPFPPDSPVWCLAPFDPEGFLSSISAIATCFIGLHYGHYLIHVKEHKRRIFNFLLLAVLLLSAGYILHLLGLKMNKPLYSLSYMCFTAGVAGGALSLLYILVDYYQVRYPTILLEWMGMNSLLIYTLAATDVLVVLIQGLYYKQPENNLANFMWERVVLKIIQNEKVAELFYVLFGIFCWCLVAGALKAKNIFWKF